jgi:hypothetical protein
MAFYGFIATTVGGIASSPFHAKAGDFADRAADEGWRTQQRILQTVIDQWVEKGKAPDSIIATRPPNQKPMTRPICRYPQTSKYKGSGSTDDAVSFECNAK